MTGEEVIKTRDALKTQRAPMEGHWDELCALGTPFHRINLEAPDLQGAEQVFDSTFRQSAQVFANGLCSLIIPREEVWFEFTPPKPLEKDDDAVKWYREASETTLDYYGASTFFQEMQESLTESPVFGTCCLYLGDLHEGELCFMHQTIGSYYIAENSKGKVDTVVRDLKYTADQAADEFGLEELPEKIAKKVGTPEGMTEKFEFIHIVTPRRGKKDADAPDNQQLPFVDIVVAVEGKLVVRRGGAYEFPFAVHRFQKHGNCVWGFGPGSVAKGDSRQLSFMNELADVGTEKAVFPPLLASSDLEGEVAQGAAECTYYDPMNGAGPNSVRELHSQARYDILKDRMADKKLAIEQAFSVDLFKLFSRRAEERAPLTATEARYIAGEKLTQFSPVYGRVMSEMVAAILNRSFGILYRAGMFRPPPASVLRQLGDGRVAGPAMPQILYQNRIALAMKARENGALMEFFNTVLPVMQAFPQLGPTVFNCYNDKALVRDLIRNSGQPEKWIATLKEIQAKEKAQAEAAAQQAKLEQAKLASESMKNLAGAPPEMLPQAGREVAG